MKIGVVHIFIRTTNTEKYIVFNTPKRMFNWIAWKIKAVNNTIYKQNLKLHKAWRISKIPNGRVYTNEGVKIIATKTHFYKKPIKE